ncbi:MAG: hypothetical protein HC817_15450 [Saprospiraceae bacterium]|nr:hypothetical protein [Saprospiraceae bacterium]
MSDKKDFFSKSFNKTKATAPPPVVQEVIVNDTVKDIHGVKLARLTLDIPQDMHRRIKIRAAEKGMSMKEYAESLFEKDLMGE